MNGQPPQYQIGLDQYGEIDAPKQKPSDTAAANQQDVVCSGIQSAAWRILKQDSGYECIRNGKKDNPSDFAVGVDQGYHQLSHHGLNDEKISQLAIIEEAQFDKWGKFIRRLHETPEGDVTLLDRTTVLLTSNLGNASSHDTKNMPVVAAGGDFRHGQHLAFNRTDNYPLPNLYTSILQQFGLNIDAFATANGTITGIS